MVGKCAFEMVLDRYVWTRVATRVDALRAGLAAVPEEAPCSDPQLLRYYSRRLESIQVESDNIMTLLQHDARLSSKLSRHGQTLVRVRCEMRAPLRSRAGLAGLPNNILDFTHRRWDSHTHRGQNIRL